MSEIKFKKCNGSVCQGQERPVSEFWKCKNEKDGLQTQCKKCRYAYKKAWDKTEKGRESNRNSLKKYDQTEKGQKKRERLAKSEIRKRSLAEYKKSEAGKLVQKKYADGEKGRETRRSALAKYRRSEHGKEAIQEYARSDQGKEMRRRYDQSEKGRIKHIRASNRRRALLNGDTSTYTVEEWNALIDLYNNTCLCCGIKGHDTKLGKLTPDHVIPLSKGGTNSIDNIQILCKPCNLRKGTSTTDYRP